MPKGDAKVRRLVKLGGAAITNKASFETLDADALQHTAAALAAAIRGDSPEARTIVVHGAGSFGHHQASKYKVAAGGLANASVKSGFAETRLSVMKLQLHVIEALIQAEIDAVGLSLMGKWNTSGRALTGAWTRDIDEALRWGFVPVLHGDAVFDDTLDCTILSGDTVMAHLAKTTHPEMVIFLTNVAGVFDRPPEQAGARLLTHIRVKSDGSWASDQLDRDLQTAQDANDTTGGIVKKIQESVDIVRAAAVDVLIVKAGSEDARVAMSLGAEAFSAQGTQALGRPFRGTLLTYADDAVEQSNNCFTDVHNYFKDVL